MPVAGELLRKKFTVDDLIVLGQGERKDVRD